MTDTLLKSQAFKLKGRLYTFTVLQLLSNDSLQFDQQLEELIAKAPRFFDKTPIVLDCSALHGDDFDLQTFCQILRTYNLQPVALQGVDSVLAAIAEKERLAVLHASASHDKKLADEREEVSEPQAVVQEFSRAKMQASPVRSGQRLVNKGGDLVITASVSHGAELLADGNIHVYGALRGRALAGMSGDIHARIFCMSLEAELLSIAGFYRLSDSIEPIHGPCQIYLENENIMIEPLC